MKDRRPDAEKIAALEDMLLDNPPEYDAEFDATRVIETRDGIILESRLLRVFLRVDPNSIGHILAYTDQHDPMMWINKGIPVEVRMVTRTQRGVIINVSDWCMVDHNQTFIFNEAMQT